MIVINTEQERRGYTDFTDVNNRRAIDRVLLTANIVVRGEDRRYDWRAAAVKATPLIVRCIEEDTGLTVDPAIYSDTDDILTKAQSEIRDKYNGVVEQFNETDWERATAFRGLTMIIGDTETHLCRAIDPEVYSDPGRLRNIMLGVEPRPPVPPGLEPQGLPVNESPAQGTTL